MKTISFSILHCVFSTKQLFFNRPFFTFLEQFTAGENYKVAGDSTGCGRFSTTVGSLPNDV